jgi:hypothetical protein
MKMFLAFAVCVAIAQYVVVPNIDTSAFASKVNAHHQAIEEATK